MCSGGGAAPQTALPSTNAVDKATGKHLGKLLEKGKGYIDEIAPKIPQVSFAEPSSNTASVDLTKVGGVEVDQSSDDDVDYLSTSLSQEQREDIMNDPNINIG